MPRRQTRLFTTLAIATLCVLMGACEWEEGYGRINDPGPHPLVGAWRGVSMEVYLDAEDGPGTRAIAMDEALWAENGLAPPEMRFTEDGLYITVYRDLEGRELQRASGYWIIDEDDKELTLFQREPAMERHSYTVTMQGGLLSRFEGLVDWNSDGKATDLYVGEQRRLRETEATIPIPDPAPSQD
ncbi:MAG: hypothetical protein JJU27_00525 [Gammaproteobacteria bacterium]|nr:hypothetical protein [Gammaproteobacteria bacterium]